ncbi:MAG: DEAD/DEAH box helicase [Patescibacteria group bacterium]
MSYHDRSRFGSTSRGRSFQSRGPRSGGNGGGRSRGKHQGQYIAPERFIQKAVEVAAEVPYVPKHQFTDFGLLPAISTLLTTRGYTTPTAIQDGVIPLVMQGKDVVGLANTGTGKTAAFLLPIIHKIKTNPQSGTALIVTPTRELAMQIEQEFRQFSANLGLYATLCVGGTSLHNQISKLRHRPHVIIGTPGRLKDLINRRALHLDNVGFFVLDEVDRMLDMGFVRDIELLMSQLPANKQTVCLSATITPAIEQLLKRLLKNPETVSVRQGNTSQGIEQNIVEFESDAHKLELLQGMLAKQDFEKVLVFGQTKYGVQRLADHLTRAGLPTEAIHGNKSQPQRARALQSFKSGKVMALVATDVAARGLDIPNVSHVINFDQPMTYDDYVHRIGRTGRAGKRGQALTFVPRRNR